MENEFTPDVEQVKETNEEIVEVEKPKLTPEQQLAIHKREMRKLEKQLGINQEEEQVKKESKEKKEDVDYSKLAYLEAKGVSEEDQEYLLQESESTGKSLKELMNFKYIQEELKNRKEARVVEEATPKGTKRSSASTRDTVDYHLAKGTPLLEISDIKLRREVQHAKEKALKDTNKFSDRPIQ